MISLPEGPPRSPYFFGEPWPSGICDMGRRVPAPIGRPCVHCSEAIEADQQGSFTYTPGGPLPVHKECSLRSVVGGIGHIEDHAYWCVTMGDPDGGRTLRQSALEVWAWVQKHGAPS